MVDETQLSRRREATSLSVPDKRGGTIVVTVYNGILPEEMLLELMNQILTLRVRKIEDKDREELWYGPEEKIQQALLSGLTVTTEGV